MSKKTKPAVSYAHVTSHLIKRVQMVIAEADNHKYSVSRVYGAHNEAFRLNAVPQTCSSCLRNRVRDLRPWLRDYLAAQGEPLKNKSGDAEQYEVLLTDFMTGRSIHGDSPLDEQYAALVDFLGEYGSTLPEPMHISLREEMDNLSKAIPRQEDTDTPYEALAKRLGLQITLLDAAGELAALNVITDADYPGELTDAEADAVLARMAELEGVINAETQEQYEDPAAPGFVPPAPGVIRYPMGDGVMPFDFTPSPDDVNKGIVINADGSKVKAGTYTAANGQEIAVQPGGKASIKVEDLT